MSASHYSHYIYIQHTYNACCRYVCNYSNIFIASACRTSLVRHFLSLLSPFLLSFFSLPSLLLLYLLSPFSLPPSINQSFLSFVCSMGAANDETVLTETED